MPFINKMLFVRSFGLGRVDHLSNAYSLIVSIKLIIDLYEIASLCCWLSSVDTFNSMLAWSFGAQNTTEAQQYRICMRLNLFFSLTYSK
jgi:hypothetical protein